MTVETKGGDRKISDDNCEAGQCCFDSFSLHLTGLTASWTDQDKRWQPGN